MNAPAARVESAQGPSADTLLFVDDEPNILSALKRTFRPLNYRILTAASGRDGLAILEREAVDVVVSDMRMPEMTGAEFLAQVAQRWPDTVRILLTGYADLQSTVAAINTGHIYAYLSKPWEENDIRISIQRALERKRLEAERRRLLDTVSRQNAELKDLNANLERKVEARVGEINQIMGMLDEANKDLKKSFHDSISVFSSIMETREGSVAGHSRRVAELVRGLAQALGMGETEAQHVVFAALLHDIGKVALSDDLITRPFAALTYDERSEVIKHPIIGEALLMSIDFLQDAARIIRSHHERYDGTGFPDGLRGEEIPLGARIVAVANDYDGLKHGRLMLDRFEEQQAQDHLVAESGRCYDPDIVARFIEMLRGQATAGQTAEAIMEPEQLRAGMRLARDMLTKSGMVLLPQGHVLDQALIIKIRALARNTGAHIRICVQRG